MIYQIENRTYDDISGIIRHADDVHKLTNKQKKLFDYFLQNQGKILSKKTLMEDVWGRIVTENSVNQFVSVLRNYIEEDSSNPKVIVTYFGRGISFEANVTEVHPINKSIEKRFKPFVGVALALAIIVSTLVLFFPDNTKDDTVVTAITTNNKGNHLLVLPMDVSDDSVSDVQKQGMQELVQSIFSNSEKEGQLVFDQSNLTAEKIVEKYWRLENELLVLQSSVLKNGDIYEAVFELKNGDAIIKKKHVSAKNLNDLLQNQVNFISTFQNESSPTVFGDKSIHQLYIEAMGYKKIGNTSKAKELIQRVVLAEKDNYQARFDLAKILLEEKSYDESYSQLQTLKSTHAYQKIGTEIELMLARINSINHRYEQLIDDLKNYQVKNPDISSIKKSKIKIALGKAYLAMGDLKNAMKFFKQALLNQELEFSPNLFAESYFGQALVLLNQSNSTDIFRLFEKALALAKSSSDYKLQVLILDEMSKMLLVSNEWDKAISLKKEALEIMELSNDQGEVAKGLGTLAAFLIQSGHFNDAKNINDRLGKIATQLKSDGLRLNYLHYDIILLLNVFEFEQAQQQIKKHLRLAQESKNYVMQLDNAFLEFELRLAAKNIVGFLEEWQKRTEQIKELGFERYQVYMDLYLARYYKQSQDFSRAIEVISKISERAMANNDIKIYVDAQNQLAEIYIETDAKKALEILNNLQQYKPDANPYLELKALAFNKLGNKVEAFNLLTQAKLVFHEAWKSENQILLDSLKKELNPLD